MKYENLEDIPVSSLKVIAETLADTSYAQCNTFAMLEAAYAIVLAINELTDAIKDLKGGKE